MKFKFSDLWRWDGTTDRGPYFLIGAIGFAIKHNADRIVASVYFKKPWGLFNYYISPDRITSLPPEDARMLLTLLILALPFIWIGVVLTVRRLRAIGWPLGLVAFFFVPFGNLLFFLLLSLMPSRDLKSSPELKTRPREGFLKKLIPVSPFGNAAMAVGLTLLFGLSMTFLGAEVFQKYGWGLFVGVPFVMGLMSALLEGYHRPQSLGRCLMVAVISVFLLSFLLLALAFEGIMCIAMAGPLALVLAILGSLVGYGIQRRPNPSNIQTTVWLLILLTPAALLAEQSLPLQPPLFKNVTSLVIEAPPEKVWPKIVGFTEIPYPREWFFQLGIAYPIRARLDGQGVGAIRHCVFSTGEFIEPIEVWEEAKELKFSVTSQPAPMEEWTPYREIHPAHLDNYLKSSGGQFLLKPLPGGLTEVQATTWYTQKMWPSWYWRIWSDGIIHSIHQRVLSHIKAEVERNGGG